MKSWIDDSSFSGVLVFVVLVSLVVVLAVEVAVISLNQYLMMKMRSIFVLLARAVAMASYSSSYSGSYDPQFVPCLQVVSDRHCRR